MKSKGIIPNQRDTTEEMEAKVLDAIEERVEEAIESNIGTAEQSLPIELADAHALLSSFRKKEILSKVYRRTVTAKDSVDDMALLARNGAGIEPEIIAQMKLDRKKRRTEKK